MSNLLETLRTERVAREAAAATERAALYAFVATKPTDAECDTWLRAARQRAARSVAAWWITWSDSTDPEGGRRPSLRAMIDWLRSEHMIRHSTYKDGVMVHVTERSPFEMMARLAEVRLWRTSTDARDIAAGILEAECGRRERAAKADA